jgi:hypothetical protein
MMVFMKLLYRERKLVQMMLQLILYTEFQKFVQEENLKPDQINNADESGLSLKGLPTRTPAFERQ